MSNKKYIDMFKIIGFDIKSMGIVFIFPFFIFIMDFLYCASYIGSVGLNFQSIMLCFEVTIPCLAAWWTIFSLQDCLEQDGRETVFTYAISRYKLGILRTFLFFIIYIISIGIFIFLFTLYLKEPIFLSVFLQLVIESFFFYSFGFLIMTLIKKAEWSIFIILAYVTTQVMSSGKVFKFINVYYFNNAILPLRSLIERGWFIIIISILTIIFAQYKFNHIKL